MKNLAGHPRADLCIHAELTAAGIEPVAGERSTGEVSACFTGRLGRFTFERDWRYWIARGPMPLAQARAIYATEVGRRDVRAGGHCGRVPPEEQTTWRAPDGRELATLRYWQTAAEESSSLFASLGGWEMVHRNYLLTDDDFAAHGAQFVEDYHIDSQEGLNLFAETVRKLAPRQGG